MVQSCNLSPSESDPQIVKGSVHMEAYFSLSSVTIGNAAVLIDKIYILNYMYTYLPWISDTFYLV